MNDNYLKVEGHNNLLRDPNTNAIINTNMSEYEQYLARRKTKTEDNEKRKNSTSKNHNACFNKSLASNR